jgi:glycosyltransferase 2 family protein
MAVEDQLERRIRKPADLLRCVLPCFGIVALAVAGIGASATTSGAQTGLVGASHRLPHALVVVASPVALVALLILPWPWPSSCSSGASSGGSARRWLPASWPPA